MRPRLGSLANAPPPHTHLYEKSGAQRSSSRGNTRSGVPSLFSQPNMKMFFLRLWPWKSQNTDTRRRLHRASSFLV